MCVFARLRGPGSRPRRARVDARARSCVSTLAKCASACRQRGEAATPSVPNPRRACVSPARKHADACAQQDGGNKKQDSGETRENGECVRLLGRCHQQRVSALQAYSPRWRGGRPRRTAAFVLCSELMNGFCFFYFFGDKFEIIVLSIKRKVLNFPAGRGHGEGEGGV